MTTTTRKKKQRQNTEQKETRYIQWVDFWRASSSSFFIAGPWRFPIFFLALRTHEHRAQRKKTQPQTAKDSNGERGRVREEGWEVEGAEKAEANATKEKSQWGWVGSLAAQQSDWSINRQAWLSRMALSLSSLLFFTHSTLFSFCSRSTKKSRFSEGASFALYL
jgi:hypothetical protein